MKRKTVFLKRYILNSGMSEDEYMQIWGEIQSSNRQNLMIFSIIAAAFLLIMFFLSFLSQDIAANRWVYLLTMFISLALFGVAKFCSEKHPGLLLAGIYAFMSILFLFGIVLGTVTRPDEQTVTFIALLLTVPLLFTDRPVRMIGCIYVYIIAFVIAALYIKEDYVLAADIIDAGVFGTISAIISTYMMSVKCQRILYGQKVVIMSEIDMLTGVRNRNSYEQNLSIYPSLCKKNLSCIFADLNGLHELNNTKGHEAGDKMLQFVAGKLVEQFGKNNTYRIGGDEFVSFVIDGCADEIQKKINMVVRSAKEQEYYVSIGYDTGFCSDMDMGSLINTAEMRMYAAKKQFYQQKGMDRRIRVCPGQEQNMVSGRLNQCEI